MTSVIRCLTCIWLILGKMSPPKGGNSADFHYEVAGKNRVHAKGWVGERGKGKQHWR